MFTGMDSVGPGMAPVRNELSPTAFFFITWLVVGAFSLMNLFVGVRQLVLIAWACGLACLQLRYVLRPPHASC